MRMGSCIKFDEIVQFYFRNKVKLAFMLMIFWTRKCYKTILKMGNRQLM